MYDDKHRFHVISLDERYPEYEQKGLREKLLCQACETKLSVWEGYGRDFFTGNAPLRYEGFDTGEGYWVHGIDYEKLRLFQLSVIWRASVSQHAFFANVSLGPHEERLRIMLLTQDPGDPGRYPCLMFHVHLDGGPAAVMAAPTPCRLDGALSYRFLLAGMFWVFAIASHNLHPRLTKGFLQRNGTMALVPPKNVRDAPFLQNFMDVRRSKGFE